MPASGFWVNGFVFCCTKVQPSLLILGSQVGILPLDKSYSSVIVDAVVSTGVTLVEMIIGRLTVP